MFQVVPVLKCLELLANEKICGKRKLYFRSDSMRRIGKVRYGERRGTLCGRSESKMSFAKAWACWKTLSKIRNTDFKLGDFVFQVDSI